MPESNKKYGSGGKDEKIRNKSCKKGRLIVRWKAKGSLTQTVEAFGHRESDKIDVAYVMIGEKERTI